MSSPRTNWTAACTSLVEVALTVSAGFLSNAGLQTRRGPARPVIVEFAVPRETKGETPLACQSKGWVIWQTLWRAGHMSNEPTRLPHAPISTLQDFVLRALTDIASAVDAFDKS